MAEKEYIERASIYSVVKRHTNPYGKPTLDYESGVKVLDMIKREPAADVAPVVHGEWIPSPDGIHPIKCSNCGADAPYRRESDFTHDIGIRLYKSNYCPNCFAKMDGGKEDAP